jgi:hypothetical protein
MGWKGGGAGSLKSFCHSMCQADMQAAHASGSAGGTGSTTGWRWQQRVPELPQPGQRVLGHVAVHIVALGQVLQAAQTGGREAQ